MDEMENQPAQKPPSSTALWSRGIVGGLMHQILVGGFFWFLDRTRPLGENFSAEGAVQMALLVVGVGFATTKFEERAGPIDFTGKWGYLTSSMIVGSFFLFPSPHAGFIVISYSSSLIFGAWLKMRWIESKRPHRNS